MNVVRSRTRYGRINGGLEVFPGRVALRAAYPSFHAVNVLRHDAKPFAAVAFLISHNRLRYDSGSKRPSKNSDCGLTQTCPFDTVT